jgi:hypothetical protein
VPDLIRPSLSRLALRNRDITSSDAADARESKCPSGATLADRETIATLECEPLEASRVRRNDFLKMKNSRCRIIATSDQ